jgi:hypothetical protein
VSVVLDMGMPENCWKCPMKTLRKYPAYKEAGEWVCTAAPERMWLEITVEGTGKHDKSRHERCPLKKLEVEK